MKKAWKVLLLPLVFLVILTGCDQLASLNPLSPTSSYPTGKGTVIGDVKEAAKDTFSGQNIPKRINGVELGTINGWLAGIYSAWDYDVGQATVYPVPELWTPYQPQNTFQISQQSDQLNQYGSGGDVLQFNPNPAFNDLNYWRANYFSNGSRPFFVLYEHINGTRYIPPNDTDKDMNNEANRQVFRDDIKYIFDNVIIPNQPRYITVNGRAVIFLWASPGMTGDFGSLLEEAKKKYPVFFIGSDYIPNDPDSAARVTALDGIMQYTILGNGSYAKAVQNYYKSAFAWRRYLRKVESETGKKILLIPTFQVARNDTKVPGRIDSPLYPRTREELEYGAQVIRDAMDGGIFDRIGPYVVYSELFEGAAVIESQCLPETADTGGRYVGCGKARLKIINKFFGY